MSVKIDWQNEFKGNISRVEHVLHNEKFTDCQFLVGQESDEAVTIRGHKLFLAIASPVFERMFFGSFDNDVIRIPDIETNIFHMMLDYIYFEKLELKTVEDAMELYSAANKYMLQDLMRRCIDYLINIKKMNMINRWKIYEFAVLFGEKVLMDKAANWMAYYTKELLEDPTIVDANFLTLIALFERDCLVIDSELDLFLGLHEYALVNGYLDTKNDVENKEVESEIEKKNLLREALKQIRYLCLTAEEFKIVAKSGLLTDSEILSILWNLNYPDELNRPMPEGFSKSRTQRSSDF